MMAKKRILSWLVAASLALSLVPSAALAADETETQTPPTLSDEILAPGRDNIIDEANDNAQDLIDDTYNALNPLDPEDTDAKPAEGKKVEDILVQKKDEEGNVVKDENGKDVFVQKKDEEGNVVKDENGKEVLEVQGDVLEKADKAAENAVKTKTDVEKALTVEVTTEEDGTEKTEKKMVDVVVQAEAAKAEAAADAARKAADAADAAVEANDQGALDQAKTDAAQAVLDANTAYNNAQTTFDGVIDSLLNDPKTGEPSEADKAALAAETAKALEAAGVTEPAEDASDEEKAAYAAALVNAQNTAKMVVANAKIDAKYSEANGQINTAKTALQTALDALNTAKETYDDAANAILKNENLSDIAVYVGYFDGLTADEGTYKKVSDAYGKVDKAETDVNTKKSFADALEENSKESTTQYRVNRDNDFLITKGNTFGCVIYGDVQLKDALEIVQKNRDTLTTKMEQLRNESDPEKRASLCKDINAAMEAVYGKTYDTTLLRTPYGMIHDRSKNANWGEVLDVNKGLNAAAERLVANLDTIRSQYDQVMAEEALKDTLASLTPISDYQKALQVVKALADAKGNTSDEKREAIKDAADRLAQQKKAAEAAQDKVNEANKAYEAAKKAVEDAQKKLNDLTNPEIGTFNQKTFDALKQQLTDAKDALDKAKEDKDEAEDEKKRADDAVIETEEEIEDIITGGTGDTDTTADDDDATIEDGIVPLALMPTRGELMNYLYVRAGSPAASAPTFTDVPADHMYAAAIGWAQQSGIAVAYEDGTFDPDNFVIAADMTAFLTSYARYAGMTMPTLSTMAGLEDDAIVENADEILAEFFEG